MAFFASVQNAKEVVQEEKPKFTKPITAEEWLASNESDDGGGWPKLESQQTSFAPSDLLGGVLAGDKEELAKEIETAAPLLIDNIDDVASQIQQLDSKLHQYDAYLGEEDGGGGSDNDEVDGRTALDLEDSDDDDKTSFNVFLTNTTEPAIGQLEETTNERNINSLQSSRNTKPPEAEPPDILSPKEQKQVVKKKDGGGTSNNNNGANGDAMKPRLRMKLVELATYPGFVEKELTPLPGMLEAQDVINRVSQSAIMFSKSLHLEFDKWFSSEGSIAIIHDVFWWFFMHKYAPNPEAQDKVFTRCADSYVALFTSTQSKFKDDFLRVYPDLLSQVVYSSFCYSFPKSGKRFGDAFKTELSSIVTEWFTGLKPPKNSWYRWCLPRLEPKAMLKEMQADEDSHSIHLLRQPGPGAVGSLNAAALLNATSTNGNGPGMNVDDGYNIIDALAIEGGNGGGATATGTDNAVSAGNGENKPVTNVVTLSSSSSKRRPKKPSCPSGPEPKSQRVLFDTLGYSPLVAHYMRVNLFAKDAGCSILVQRTERNATKLTGVSTFRDIIDANKALRNRERQNFESTKREALTEQVRIERERRHGQAQVEQARVSLMSHYESIKLLSDKIVDSLKPVDGSTVEDIKANDFLPYIQPHSNAPGGLKTTPLPMLISPSLGGRQSTGPGADSPNVDTGVNGNDISTTNGLPVGGGISRRSKIG